MTWDVIVVGYGPCGAALSWLLASRGLRVLALERQVDLHRAFRGEGLQPSGVAALLDMGLGPALEAAPQSNFRRMLIHNGRRISAFDVAPNVGVRVVSQGGLLDAIARQTLEQPGFELRRGAVFADLVTEGGRVVGVRARHEEGVLEHRARLVVATDGRGSAVARKAGIARSSLEQGYDVLWFKVDLSALLADRQTAWLEVNQGRTAIAYPSPDGLDQVGLILPKGAIPEGTGQERLDRALPLFTPELAAAIQAGRDQLVGPTRLAVVCERAERWSIPGLLLLGDAAHPMSPVGGQGINMALRDAIVAANHLVPALRGGSEQAVDAAAVALAKERKLEVEPVQAIQTRSGRRMLRPPRLLLWLLPIVARLGLKFRATGDRARIQRGLRPVTLSV